MGLSTSSTRHSICPTSRSPRRSAARLSPGCDCRPIGGPVCEVVTVAKRDLKAGERLDGVGGFCTYGLIENGADRPARCMLCPSVCQRLCIAAGCGEGRCRVVTRMWSPALAAWLNSSGVNRTRYGLLLLKGRRCRLLQPTRQERSGEDTCAASTGELFMLDRAFWKGRRVFLTGHTGFKGSWLSIWLDSLGADVTGYALDPPTQPNSVRTGGGGRQRPLHYGDIRDFRG